MSVLTTIALTASLAATAYSAVKQQKAAGKAADAQKESSRIAGNQTKIQEMVKRRQEIREQRVRTAQMTQSAENSGVAGSSSEIGSIGSLGSITGNNVASSFGAERTSGALNALGQKSADAQAQGSMWGAVGGLSGQIFQSEGGFGELKDQFSKIKIPKTSTSGLRNMNRSKPS
jgi:hypothetical protein